MTEVTKPTKPVAPETVRLFEIIGFGQTNEEEYKSKVKNIMEVTGCEEEMAILTLHDCNDETEAIQRLLDSNTAPAQEGWFTKKKTNKRKLISNSVESESLDAPKAYVTDGHSGESVEGRRNVKSRERERGSGSWREKKGSQKGSGESWDDDETTDTSKNEFRHDRNKPLRNGFSNNSPSYNERRDQDGEERQSSRIFLSKRTDRPHPDDHDRYLKERSNRDGQNKDRRNPRPYRERKPFRNGDDRDRSERNQWNQSKYNRDRDEVGEHELDDRQRDRKFGKKGFNKRSDKERIVYGSSNGSSKTTPELNGDIYINSRDSADTIDWDNPVLSNTDWGEEEVKKELEDDADEDKCIEALLSEGCVFHNSNYDLENGDVGQTNIVNSSISTSPLPQPSHETSNSHPIFSPQTTSLPTPFVTIPAPAPPSHSQAAGVVFCQAGRMNLKRKARSKIPKVPVELPNADLDSFDIQFGSITLPVTQVDSLEDSKPTESPSPVEEEKTFSNAKFQESDLSTSNGQSSPSAHKNTEQPPLPSSPPPNNDQPIPPRSPVPQDKQPPISDTPTSQQAPVAAPVTVPSHSQPHPQYHQHMNRQNERKAYSENSGKMHHQGGMSGNSVKLQQHPQIVPSVNSIDQPPGVPYLMTPMATVGGPNALPPTTMSNLPRGPGKNFQTPVLYNPPGQYGMLPNYYWDQDMIRMMATQNNIPASNMVKEQNSNQVFQNNDAKFHEPTSPANPQTGMQGQSVYVPFHGYGFIPGMFPMIPKSNTYPNPVTAGGQTPYQTQPPLPPNIPTHPDQHSDYKPNFANIQQKPGAMAQAADMQNMYKSYDQKSAIPFGFSYPFAQYVNPQMMPQQQPQYSNLNPNMLMQQPLDGQRPKW